MTRWWWVRHAPVTANQGRCYGQTDFPCETGNAAAFAGLARLLPRDALWVATPLQRTQLTAEAIVTAGLPASDPITIEPEFIEQHFGDWQGVTYADLTAERSDQWHRFWLAAAEETPPNGESFAALTVRVQRAIRRWNDRHPDRDIVAVTHGGTIRAAIALALDVPPAVALGFGIDNLSLTRLEFFPDAGGAHSWRVGTVNQPPA